ncbi:MAG: hypothetical protein JWR61_1318 [Ferruginibacter sp.]|uniref:hypothetical protein n=1 Tax=Ferruginibacter sp. TaxID=1940288 RepID=UPI00265ABB89|nr:hypothetical protein [Ferruginibacter sp.]MDB5276363.1 hypothetical protein [Ferruginibacter sp.]
MPTPKLSLPKIGSIVALNSHPFFQRSDKDTTFISGDQAILSPLMVVAEILTESKSAYDESTGTEIIKKGTFQYKCIWYSSKSGHFEESWISSRLIKLIETDTISLGSKDLEYGALVTFKTVSIELSKKKMSLNADTSSQKLNRTITGILPFTSPVLQIIGFLKSESKEPLIDIKTGEVRRIISSQLVKCKFFNFPADKFSDVVLPIEVLQKSYEISSTLLVTLNKAIADKTFLMTASQSPRFKETFIKPRHIVYKAGCYFLDGIDYLENRTVEVLIEGKENQFQFLDNKFDHLPNFTLEKDKLNIIGIGKKELEIFSKKIYWRIKYKDVSDNFSIRTIYEVSFFANSKTENGRPISIDYLKAKCILSNCEERFFRIDRIQSIKFLDIDFQENIK